MIVFRNECVFDLENRFCLTVMFCFGHKLSKLRVEPRVEWREVTRGETEQLPIYITIFVRA